MSGPLQTTGWSSSLSMKAVDMTCRPGRACGAISFPPPLRKPSTLDAEHFGDVRAMEIRVEKSHLPSVHGQFDRQIDGDGALAHAAFPAHHQDSTPDPGHRLFDGGVPPGPGEHASLPRGTNRLGRPGASSLSGFGSIIPSFRGRRNANATPRPRGRFYRGKSWNIELLEEDGV